MNSPSRQPPKKTSSRPYRSAVREEGAERTKQRILEAALALFVAHGYARTTVDEIASAAGVARPTFFAAVGTKAELLKLLRDRTLAGDDEPVPVSARSWFQEALMEPDAWRSIQLHARNMATIYQRYALLDAVVQQAAGVDAELAAFARLSESQRRMGASTFVQHLIEKAGFRKGLDSETATDALWALTGSDTYRRLVIEREWSVERYQEWVTISAASYLLE